MANKKGKGDSTFLKKCVSNAYSNINDQVDENDQGLLRAVAG